jgi:hypothetical protein
LSEYLDRWELEIGRLFRADDLEVAREHEPLSRIGTFANEIRRRSEPHARLLPSSHDYAFDIIPHGLPPVMRNASILFDRLMAGLDSVREQVRESFHLLAATVTTQQLVLAQEETTRREHESQRRDRFELGVLALATLFLGPSVAAAVLQALGEDTWWIVVMACVGSALLFGAILGITLVWARRDRNNTV